MPTLARELSPVDVEAHLAAIVESSHDAIISKDLDGTILSWNSGAEQLYGYAREEAVGRSINLIVPPELQSEVAGFLHRIAEGGRVDHHDTRRVRKDGSCVEISLTISPIRASDGTVSGASVIARDISDRKRLERKLVQMASQDQLTGIANRRTFIRRLERHVEQCQQTTWRGGLVVLDIDRFKDINDTLGHGAGDQVLTQTAARIAQQLSGDALFARLGGDEFAVLLADADSCGVAAVARAIVVALARHEIAIGGQRCATASVGWTTLDGPVAADEAMTRADLALYESKRKGGNVACAYDATRDGGAGPEPSWQADVFIEDLRLDLA